MRVLSEFSRLTPLKSATYRWESGGGESANRRGRIARGVGAGQQIMAWLPTLNTSAIRREWECGGSEDAHRPHPGASLGWQGVGRTTLRASEEILK